MTPEDYLALGERFVAAIQSGEADEVRRFYAPDAKLWHNTDGLEQTVEQNLKSLAWFKRNLPDRNYRVLRREALADGFMQQHVLEATLPDGTKWTLDACVVVRVKDGLITRLDEYIDGVRTAELANVRRPAD